MRTDLEASTIAEANWRTSCASSIDLAWSFAASLASWSIFTGSTMPSVNSKTSPFRCLASPRMYGPGHKDSTTYASNCDRATQASRGLFEHSAASRRQHCDAIEANAARARTSINAGACAGPDLAFKHLHNERHTLGASSMPSSACDASGFKALALTQMCPRASKDNNRTVVFPEEANFTKAPTEYHASKEQTSLRSVDLALAHAAPTARAEISDDASLITAANKGKANHKGGANQDSSSKTPSVLMISSISFCDACHAFDSRASLTAKASVAALRSALRRASRCALNTSDNLRALPRGSSSSEWSLALSCRVASTSLAKCLSTQACCHRASPNTALFSNGFVFASSANIARAVVSAKRTERNPSAHLLRHISSAPDNARPSAATKAPLTDPSASPFVSWTHRQHARAPSRPSDSLPGRRISSTNAAVAKCRAAAAPLAFLLGSSTSLSSDRATLNSFSTPTPRLNADANSRADLRRRGGARAAAEHRKAACSSQATLRSSDLSRAQVEDAHKSPNDRAWSCEPAPSA
mmetsp:Transcript_18946/g.58552  ORF Transcript_18946/g.58552 Transcript_18946/m.58552 type:complete len:528 (+) Transcript_18946:4092-5675(+)